MTNPPPGVKRDWRDAHFGPSGRDRYNDRDRKRRRTSRSRSRDRRRDRERDPKTTHSIDKRDTFVRAKGDPDEVEEGEISDPDYDSPAPAPTPQIPTGPRVRNSRTPEISKEPSPPREPEPELEIVDEPAVDMEQTLAERRRRRAEILAKYTSVNGTPQDTTPVASTPLEQPPALDDAFELSKADSPTGADGEGGVGAADYDPSLDRREDVDRLLFHQAQGAQVVMDVDEDEEVEIIEEEEEEDVDDMFALDDDDDEKPKKKIIKKVLKKLKKNLGEGMLPGMYSHVGCSVLMLGS